MFIFFLSGFKRPNLANYEKFESPESRIKKWLTDYDASDADNDDIDNDEAVEKEYKKKMDAICKRNTKSVSINVHIFM
jgi:hypothetical protein